MQQSSESEAVTMRVDGGPSSLGPQVSEVIITPSSQKFRSEPNMGTRHYRAQEMDLKGGSFYTICNKVSKLVRLWNLWAMEVGFREQDYLHEAITVPSSREV